MPVHDRTCEVCASRYQALKVTARYCGDRCRKRAQRSGVAAPAKPPTAPSTAGVAPAADSVTAAVLDELVAAGKHNSALGRACLVLAGRLDIGDAETGAGLSALARQMQAALEATVAQQQPAKSAFDELLERRMKRRGASA